MVLDSNYLHLDNSINPSGLVHINLASRKTAISAKESEFEVRTLHCTLTTLRDNNKSRRFRKYVFDVE